MQRPHSLRTSEAWVESDCWPTYHFNLEFAYYLIERRAKMVLTAVCKNGYASWFLTEYRSCMWKYRIKHCFAQCCQLFGSFFFSLSFDFSGILNHLSKMPQGTFHLLHTSAYICLNQFPKSLCSFRDAFELNKWQTWLNRLIRSAFYRGSHCILWPKEKKQKPVDILSRSDTGCDLE